MKTSELAKELYEVCCYPDPTPWDNISQDEKDVWNYRASIIGDKYTKSPSGLVAIDEKEIRIKYQDIVYKICQLFDYKTPDSKPCLVENVVQEVKDLRQKYLDLKFASVPVKISRDKLAGKCYELRCKISKGKGFVPWEQIINDKAHPIYHVCLEDADTIFQSLPELTVNTDNARIDRLEEALKRVHDCLLFPRDHFKKMHNQGELIKVNEGIEICNDALSDRGGE